MNNTYIKRWIAGLLVVIMAASAAVFADSKSEVFHKTTKRSDKKELVPFTSSGPLKLQAPQKEEEELVTVNIILKYDEEKYEPTGIFSDWHYYGWEIDSYGFKSEEIYEVDVRKDIKQLVARFIPKGAYSTIATYPIYLAFDLENVTDGATLVFDTAEATERYEFIPVREDGTPVPASSLYDNGKLSVVIVSQKGYLGGHTLPITCFDGYDNPEIDLPYPGIFTNPLSESFTVNCTFNGIDFFTRDWYIIQFPPVRQSGIYKNDPDLFIDHQPEFGITQFSKSLIENEADFIWTSIVMEPTYNGYSDDSLLSGYNAPYYYDLETEIVTPTIINGISKHYFKICLPDISMHGSDCFEFRFKDLFSEPLPDDPTLVTFMPHAFVKDGVITYYPINEVGALLNDGWYTLTLDNTVNPTYFPKVNPNLVMSENQLATIPGNNTPILVSVLAYEEWTGELPDEIYPTLIDNYDLEFEYKGRCLETRMSDRLLAEVVHDENDLYHIFTIKNENMLIDNEIQGTNTTTLGLMKNRADFVPPTLQTLQIKDAEGNINDRINGPGSVMEIYAGDFYYYKDFETNAFMMKCRPIAAMLVEYAPTGTTDFKEMTFTEDPEKFFLPGSGYFFSSPMDDILADCSEGWYDLKVTIFDEQLNLQTQVISPVFYVGDGAGVTEVKNEPLKLSYAEGKVSSSEAGLMTVWGTDGRKIMETNGTSIDISGLPHGVYIAKVKTANGEKQIKVAR